MSLPRLALVGLLALTAGCSARASTDGRPQVVAGAYPLAWVAEQVGGSDVHVTDLVKPGAEPHDVELTPRQVGTVKQAEVVVYLSGFQPAVDDAVEGSNGLDLAGPTGRKGSDPHVWLDPVRMQAAAAAVAARLATVDPSHAQDYRARAKAVEQRLSALDALFRKDLTGCARTDIVTSHEAFGYLASRYGLVQKGISGFDPEAEPSPERVAEVATFAKEHGVTTIFFEGLVDPKVAKTVADEIGAQARVLDPVEGVRGTDDYLSVQRRNAAALHEALGCTG